MATVEIVERGDRKCLACGKVHDARLREPGRPSAGITWADPDDGHAYRRESWEQVARRLGFKRGV